MNWLYNIATIFSIFLILAISISAISPKCQYYVKNILFWTYYGITAAIIIPFGLITRDPPRSSSFWAVLNRLASTFILGLKWKTVGRENVDKKQTYMVVANHQTALDVLAVAHMWESFDKCTMVMKNELKYIPILGISLVLSGATFLIRGSSEHSRNAINTAEKKAKESGMSMMLFPEGTRNPAGGGSLLPFKKGAFHVAFDVGVPILPIVISEYDFLGPDGNRTEKFTSGNITIQILPPIQTEGISKDQMDDVMNQTRDSMLEALKNMRSSQ